MGKERQPGDPSCLLLDPDLLTLPPVLFAKGPLPLDPAGGTCEMWAHNEVLLTHLPAIKD